MIGVHEMAAELVAQLAPHLAALVRAKHELGLRATLIVVLHISCDDRISTPAIGFDANVIALLPRWVRASRSTPTAPTE